jgi:D-alanine-D-alanine ligase
MQTGRAVLDALSDRQPLDVVIDRTGRWLVEGRIRSPQAALAGVDVAFLALHGEYGEDGTIQRLLRRSDTRYTGSHELPSAIAFDKCQTRERLINDLPMARGRKLRRHELHQPRTITQLETELGANLFAKPTRSGSSHGARMILDTEDTYQALRELTTEHRDILVEEHVAGVEATVGVLENFRGEALYAFPVIEIVPPKQNAYFDYDAKYSGQTDEIVPGRFAPHIRDELQRQARVAHQQLGLRQYSRSDFIVRSGEVFFLEVNTLPGLTGESLYPKAAAAVGLSFTDLVAHLIETA